MSKAYRCDKCGELYDGSSEMQLQFDPGPLIKPQLGIRYSPESNGSPFYLHDLCGKCQEEFVNWWKCRSPQSAGND
jgi:hypothetical protein